MIYPERTGQQGKEGETMLERLASALGQRGEEANIRLAEELAQSENADGVREVAAGMMGKDSAAASDCVKVLYELGERKPEMIVPYVGDFAALLAEKNNRLVWGAMCALAAVAPVAPGAVYAHVDAVLAAYQKGSVITVDNSISVLAVLCKADEAYAARLFPVLLGHLESCRAKEVPQHAERAAVCITGQRRDAFVAVLEQRRSELTPAQWQRVERLTKKLG